MTSFARVDVARELASLQHLDVNYSDEEVGGPDWYFDCYRTPLPPERPGPPEPDGVWERACLLIRRYEFSMPELVRAAYDASKPLLDRNMLLELRFSALRFYVGVRVTSVVNETRDPDQRVWGWRYETLQGHLERGRSSYEVVKHQESGEIEFVADSRSQRAPTLGPVMRLGWALFGRRQQLLFYRGCASRMNRFVRLPIRAPVVSEHGLVVAPSDARAHRFDRFALRYLGPG